MLAFWTPGTVEMIIVSLFFLVPVVAIILVVRYLIRKGRENQKLRLEVGKLADELEQLRKERKGKWK